MLEVEMKMITVSEGARLAGTLCLPQEGGRFPVVLMIHGTGPLDRDENMKGQRLDVFNTIAHRLAEDGIASFRYDKRGCGQSEGDYYRTGHAELVADATRWLDILAEDDHVEKDRLYLLGHSEGCIIAPQVCIDRPGVAGMVLLCPFIDRMESILMKQAAQLESELAGSGLIKKLAGRLMGLNQATQARLIRRIRETTADTFTAHFEKLPAKALREMLELDPPSLYKQVTCPALLIGGEKDLQCDPEDVARIAGLIAGPTESHVIVNLTHVLRFEEGQPAMLRTQQLLGRPVEPVVLDTIGGWFSRN